MDKIQSLQEEQYYFPYHHLVEISPFSQTKYLLWGYKYASYINKVIDTLKEYSFNSIVDIGCGDGKLTFEIAKLFPTKRIVGTDYSEKCLLQARSFSPDIEFKKETDEKFDAFTLVEVLEHIPVAEIDKFISSLANNLNNGGIGIITTPHINQPLNKKHYQHFDKEKIYTLFENDFLIERFEYISAKNFTSILVQKLLSNHYFVLNYKPLIRYLYNLYNKKCLQATEENATQVFVVIRKR
jgi:2-polyprenyl-3-methyl-5-hydroxy-6-metoxy-1,4-benzoquinol methylase